MQLVPAIQQAEAGGLLQPRGLEQGWQYRSHLKNEQKLNLWPGAYLNGG